jgi:hypothetical protein
MAVDRRAIQAGLRALLLPLIALLLAGCATTPRIDWASRIGNYTYEQAILEFGPPDKAAKLSDGTTVAEWLTRRGYTYSSAPFGYYSYSPWWYGPAYPAYLDTHNSPDYFLRLIFGPDNRLRDWKQFYK